MKPTSPRRVNELLGIIASERGSRTEDAFFKAFEGKSEGLPRWFRGIKRPTREQDLYKKIDAIVLTDVGEIHVQIKSSLSGLRHFQAEASAHCRIVPVVIKSGDKERFIRQIVLKLVAGERKKILHSRNN